MKPSPPSAPPPLRGETVAVEKAPRKKGAKKNKEATDYVEAPVEKEEDGWQDKPSLVNQYTAERWKTSCRQCPTEMHYFSIPAELDKFNALQAEFLPLSAPRRIMISSREPDFCKTDGSYRMLVLTAKIQYRKLIPDTKTPAAEPPP